MSVKKTSTKPATPHPVNNEASSNEPKTSFEQTMYQRNLFLNMALNMTWQLAIVVIIPVVGGFKLDEHFSTSPWLTVVGFVIAALGVGGVLIRIVRVANVKVGAPGAKK